MADKAVTVKVIDPAARYGIDIIGLSPEIRAIQMYAPPAKQFVPSSTSTTSAILRQGVGQDGYRDGDAEAGPETRWHVRLHVFVP